MPLMRGATVARAIIENYLRDNLPDLLVVARDQWTLTEYELPDPAGYDSYDPLTANAFPMIGSLVSRTRNWRQRDITDLGEQVYSATYDVKVFLWVRTPATEDGGWEQPVYDSALRLRDDLLAAVRSCILTRPSLGSNGAAQVNEGTMVEDYLDAFKAAGSDQNPRWMCGGVLNFEMVLDEQNYQEAAGIAETIGIDTNMGVNDG